MEHKITEMFSEAEIAKRVCELGEQISKDYAGKEIKLICVLRGATMFYAELAKWITVPVYFDFISVSSYGDSTESSGNIAIRREPMESIEGEHVIIVEDIIDTGNTLSTLKKLFMEKGAASVKLASLLDKPSRRKVEIKGDYVGFEIPDEFVVGYGLDYAQRYRNLPYVGKIEFINK